MSNRCMGPGAAIPIGLAWEQVKPGEWERYLIRRCQSCRELEIEKLQRVDLTYPICLGCFSQDAEVDTQGSEVYLRCLKCHQRIQYVDEEPNRAADDDNWISHEGQ